MHRSDAHRRSSRTQSSPSSRRRRRHRHQQKLKPATQHYKLNKRVLNFSSRLQLDWTHTQPCTPMTKHYSTHALLLTVQWKPQTTWLHPALSCAAASVFLQLYLKPAIHSSFFRPPFRVFLGHPHPLRPCSVHSTFIQLQYLVHQESNKSHKISR